MEIKDIRQRVASAAAHRTQRFLDDYYTDPDTLRLAAWFVPRAWREIEYVFMLGEELRRYGLTFERRHITALARHLEDEAEHYDAVARIITGLGGGVPTAVPPSAQTWSAFLWDSLDRHRLGAIAAWYISETAAIGSLRGTLEAGARLELPEVVRAYQQIEKDENFHVGLGAALLERYTEGSDVPEIMRSMRGMADILVQSAYVVEA